MAGLPKKSSAPRGSTLLLTVIVMAVLALLAAGTITLSGTELGAAASKRRYDTLTACARGGRDLILSQFRLSNQLPTSLSARLGGTGTDLLIASGHYDSASLPDPGAGSGLTYSYRPIDQAGSNRGPEDIANKMTGGGAANPVTYVLVCEDEQKKRYELEFTLQFGF